MSPQYILPKRRRVSKMGVREVSQKVWSRHRRWVKSHGCCVPGCTWYLAEPRPIDFAHVKSRGAGGQDWHGISLCRLHHEIQHKIGIDTFSKKFGIDLAKLAAEFARTSPDTAMREAMKEHGI